MEFVACCLLLLSNTSRTSSSRRETNSVRLFFLVERENNVDFNRVMNRAE